MTALSIETTHQQDHTILTLTGELDRLSTPRLHDAIDTTLAAGHHHLVVDTAGLSFCDSTGLRALLQTQQRTKATEGTFQLSNVHGVLHRLLDITKLIDAFVIIPTPHPPSTEPTPTKRENPRATAGRDSNGEDREDVRSVHF